MNRLLLCALLAIAALLAGCTRGDDPERPGAPGTPPGAAPSPPGQVVFSGPAPAGSPLAAAPALASLTGSGFNVSGSARVDVLALERVAPDAVTLRFRIANAGDQPIQTRLQRSGVGDLAYDVITANAGMFLLDHEGLLLHLPMRERDIPDLSPCLCSYDEEPSRRIEPGGPPVLGYAVYQVDPEVTSLAVGSEHLGLTDPLPISQGRPDTPRFGDEPAAAAIGAAFGYNVELASSSEGRAQAVDETPDEVRIRLNTDVLFAFDRADLTGGAQAELRRVADRLRSGATGTVRVTGHTDDVGADAYNLDLSRRRAGAVHRALTGLVAGTSLRFEVQGKGEAEPVAQGTSDEARARNRRVEISFERAQPAAPPPTTAPPTTAPPPAAGTPSPGTPLGTAVGGRALTGLTMDVLQARRVSANGVLLEARVRNGGGSVPNLRDVPNDPDARLFRNSVAGYQIEFHWPVLTDDAGTRYYPVGQANATLAHCVCTVFRLDPLPAGQEARVFALMTAPPPGTRQVSLSMPGFSRVDGIPISG